MNKNNIFKKLLIILAVAILFTGSYFTYNYINNESIKAEKQKAIQQKLESYNQLRAKLQQDLRSTASNKNELIKQDKKQIKELEKSL